MYKILRYDERRSEVFHVVREYRQINIFAREFIYLHCVFLQCLCTFHKVLRNIEANTRLQVKRSDICRFMRHASLVRLVFDLIIVSLIYCQVSANYLLNCCFRVWRMDRYNRFPQGQHILNFKLNKAVIPSLRSIKEFSRWLSTA